MYDGLYTVSSTVDAQGFVLVDGVRVLNAKGVMLKSRTSYQAHCQLCGQVNVTIPLRVVTEFEHAINARRYFHASPVGAFSDYRLCDGCKVTP